MRDGLQKSPDGQMRCWWGSNDELYSACHDGESHLVRAKNLSLKTIRLLESPGASSADAAIRSISGLPKVIDRVLRG